jgi:hypothetical protein
MSEVDKFFEGFTNKDKEITDDLMGTPVVTPAKVDDDVEESTLKNRRERRMAEKLQAERDSAIALNERVKYLAEENARLKNQPVEVITDPEESLIYGTDENGQRMRRFFEKKFSDAEERGAQRALEEFEARQSSVTSEQKEYEGFIDKQLVSLEEEHNIDLTSNAPGAVKNRKEFLELVERLSPKDSRGAIKEYADFDSTFEIYKGMKSKPEPSRAKELASRSMQTSTGSGREVAPEGPMTFAKARQHINRMFSN